MENEDLLKDDLIKYFKRHKTFKKGSPIEWHHPLLDTNQIHNDKTIRFNGIYEVWMTAEEFQEEFNYIIGRITKDKMSTGEYLGYVASQNFVSIPIPQLVGYPSIP